MMSELVSSEEKKKIKNYVSKLQSFNVNNEEIDKSFISQVLDELCILNGNCLSIPVSFFHFALHSWYFTCTILENNFSSGQVHLY